jgi:hypothetical protein
MDCNPGIIFLGVCKGASCVIDMNVPKWNIHGLSHIILSHIYPFPLSGITIGIALDKTVIKGDTKLIITDQKEREIAFVTLNIRIVNPTIEEVSLKTGGPILIAPEKGWTITFLRFEKNDAFITRPGIYYINVENDGQKKIIGEVQFAVIDHPPLSKERIAALKSDPTSAKSIRIELYCKKCHDKFRAYADLEPPNIKLEEDGYNLHTSIPDQFICECGKTNVDLQFIRKNLHGLLGERRREGLGLEYTPLYEKSILVDTINKFVMLINSKPKEVILQKFIEENLILLHQFPSEKIIFKPPILTFYKADFGIVSPQKELILIEIEKTTTKLLKKDGGLHSALNHAFDQVRDWLHIVDDHRSAILDSLKINRDQVSSVRGVVIVGRDSDYDARNLRKLKGSDFGTITFLTYDDLLFSLDSLYRNIKSI